MEILDNDKSFCFRKVWMASIFYTQLIVVIVYMCNYNAIGLRFLRVSIFAIECIHLKEIVTLTIGFLQ